MTNSEKFCRLNGIEWHAIDKAFLCSCNKNLWSQWECDAHLSNCNPTYADAKSILEVMMKREDWSKFLDHIGQWDDDMDCRLICLDYILNPDKLLDEAIRWCEEHEKIN